MVILAALGNHYEIKLKDENGERLLSYQGNWRIFSKNWEARWLLVIQVVHQIIYL